MAARRPLPARPPMDAHAWALLADIQFHEGRGRPGMVTYPHALKALEDRFYVRREGIQREGYAVAVGQRILITEAGLNAMHAKAMGTWKDG